MARLTEAAQNLRHVLANSDSDSITKTKDKIKPKTTTTTTTNDLADTEAAASKLVQDDVAEEATSLILASLYLNFRVRTRFLLKEFSSQLISRLGFQERQ